MARKYGTRVERVTRTYARRRLMALRAVPNCNITRGFSYTHFPKNTLGKGLLDRCGRDLNMRNDADDVDAFIEAVDRQIDGVTINA